MKHKAMILMSYDDRSSEALMTFVADGGESDGLPLMFDERSTPSKVSSVLALWAIEWLLRITAEDAGPTSSSSPVGTRPSTTTSR